MTRPAPTLVALAAVAGLQGAALVGYAGYVAINGFREGTTGPAEVSNVPALVSLVVILAILGAGLGLIARGWWQSRHWARSPFVLAQLLIGLVGWEASQSSDSAEHVVGLAGVVVAIGGIVLAFVPATRRAIGDGT